MKSRRYVIFSNGYTTLYDSETVIGPADIGQVIKAFYNFFLRYYTNRGENFCVFAAPTTLDEVHYGPVEVKFWSTCEDLPVFDGERILKKLYPELSDPLEYIDRVEFKRIYKQQY